MKTQKHQMLWLAVFAVALSLGFVPQTALASEATGQFIINDETALFTHAYALVQPDAFDERQEVVLVIVSNFPLSASEDITELRIIYNTTVTIAGMDEIVRLEYR